MFPIFFYERNKRLRILFIGDIVGKIGRRMVKENLPELKREYNIQYTIANGENAAHGKGMTKAIYKELMGYGVDFITLGNHAFHKDEVFELFEADKKIIRPLNYPSIVPGEGFKKVNINNETLMIVNLQGRSFMESIDNPFTEIDALLKRESADQIFVDFHCETTSEAIAMGYYLDGRVNAVVGTHTHVQTNDAVVLDNGTMYITDVGMTGYKDGILGIDKEAVISRFLDQLPKRHVVPDKGDGILSAVVIDTVKQTIEPILIRE